jgi:hypothetical protein
MSPDIRKHRGAHPKDRKLFADDQLIALRTGSFPVRAITASATGYRERWSLNSAAG